MSTPAQVGIMDPPLRSQCPYCGVGCGLELLPPAAKGRATLRGQDGTPVWGARGDRHHPSSLGQVCIKGATVGQTLDNGRLTRPLYRPRLDLPLQPVTWDRAFTILLERIRSTLTGKGPQALAMYGSGQFHCEDYYMAQKLLKGALGTNNFDANSRLCMSSAVAGYTRSLGSDGPPCCYEDLDQCDLALVIGANMADCHPVLFQRLAKRRRKRRHKKDLQIIVVDPRQTATSSAADVHLAIRPGTDLVLLHGIGHLLLRQTALDFDFIEGCTDGFFAYAKLLQDWTPNRVASICGISSSDLRLAARLWARSRAALSLWSMGVNQSVEGTATVSGLINLHLLTGQMGRPGAGPFSLTGQPNAMGGREAGGLAHLLPGYRQVSNPQHRADVEARWKLGPIAAKPGLNAWQQIEAMGAGALDLWWVAATNPLVSMPQLEKVKTAMARCPLVVVSEAYSNTETSRYAHLVLPAAQWSEKDGVMVNSERRVTFCPGFRGAPGEARADWQVFAELGRRLGFVEQFSYGSAAEVYGEFVTLSAGRVCDTSGLSHDLLRREGPQQWPFPAGVTPGRGSRRLYEKGAFPTPTGRARFMADQPGGLAEPPDRTFPLVLTTGRYLGHWHTMTRTGQLERLRRMHPEPLLEVNPVDATVAGLADGAVALIRSRRGQVTARVSVRDQIRPGSVFLPMHWGGSQDGACEVNDLMHALGCPISQQPELKAAAVQLTPAG